MDLQVRKTLGILVIGCSVFSQYAMAANCINNPNLPLDGINLNLGSEGLQANSRALVGAAVTLKAEAFWQSSEMYDTPLNVQLYLDGSLQGQNTTSVRSSGLTVSKIYDLIQ